MRFAFVSADEKGGLLDLSGEIELDQLQWVLPSRLQAVQTVYAMTVHKSQGSEFLHTALVLPDRSNLILTRELIYTGITRAKRRLTLVKSGRGMLKEAVSRKVMRVSGLGEHSI